MLLKFNYFARQLNFKENQNRGSNPASIYFSSVMDAATIPAASWHAAFFKSTLNQLTPKFSIHGPSIRADRNRCPAIGAADGLCIGEATGIRLSSFRPTSSAKGCTLLRRVVPHRGL
ncbi:MULTISPECIES: hypothetical protein [unclassified Variovorax]|uniref:hypothetical protein n=1 Tax=unclassified Variovorax TaxID=663243 RepID=UPI001ACA527D|nr:MULTISPECIES: hypothetical protein [unclassified Variovorax]MBN8755666.1 hypothetical protein [Variovorax sp.]